MAEVILKNVSKVYDHGNKVVTDASFKVEDKEFVVIVGPSGCGKSTTLRMIAGLEEITGGEIYIGGKLVNNLSPKDRDIAMVFQNYALYPHMTVYENMAFGLKLQKVNKSEIEQRVNDAAKILGLEPYLDRKPKALSGGQRQRVAVGRAIVRKPKVFLFDEPLSNLDAKLRVQMRTEISKLHKQLGATMIYVTHDQTEAMTMGNRIVIMKDGIINQVDSPLNLYYHPANKFIAGFIGSPAMNFIEGKIVRQNSLMFISDQKNLKFAISGEVLESLKNYVDKEIWLGIRPEDITPHNDSDTKEDSVSINVQLDLVEPLGNQILMYFTFEGKQLVSDYHGYIQTNNDTLIEMKINLSKVHFFDKLSEARIELIF